jgi:hypothetical protein
MGWESPTPHRGRLLAMRIIGWVVGVLTLGYSVAVVLISIASDDQAQTIHRFHYLAGLAGGGLIGVFSILFVQRPGWTAVFHALVAQAIAWTIGGLMGGDVVTGFYVTAPVGVILLAALHPDPRSLLRLPGRPSVALLIYALLVTVPAWIYAVAEAELQHGPAADSHVQMHHWSGIAVAALSIAGAAIATSRRAWGGVVVGAPTAIAGVLFGIAGLVFPPDDYAGAPPTAWSWVAVAAGVGFWLLARIEAAREAASE